MTIKDYRAERRGGLLRSLFLVLLVLFVLLLLYLFVPFGTGRVVLLGSDARAEEVSRADTIMLAKANGGLLAVPRDTLAEIPGLGEDKVNAAFANGGPELTVETLENLTGLPVENYVVLDFGGTREIVDALGGITVNVEEPIETQQDGEFFSIPAGPQELTGAPARPLGWFERGDLPWYTPVHKWRLLLGAGPCGGAAGGRGYRGVALPRLPP